MSSNTMFFLGSTGYIGGSVLTSILLSPTPPSSVVCLVRSPEKAKLLESLDLNGGKTKISCLVGSMEEHDKITKAAAEADVVVNTANADDLGCVKALVEGFKERKRKTTHRTIYIHTSGTGVMVDDARGNRPSDLIYTDLRPAPASRSSPALHSLDDIPSSAPHREVDIFITQSDARSECKAYIVLPSTIWGWGKGEIYDKGVSNPHSDQMPTMARIALDRGRAGVVGKGANIWPHVHISDTASLFSLIYTRALSASSSSSAPASSHIGHGTSGFYLAIAGEYTLLTAARAIGVALIDAGLSSSSDASPTALSEEEMKKYYGGSYYMGGNSRGRADRSKSIGWKPDWTDERDFIKSVKEEVGRMEGMYGKEMKEATAKVY